MLLFFVHISHSFDYWVTVYTFKNNAFVVLSVKRALLAIRRINMFAVIFKPRVQGNESHLHSHTDSTHQLISRCSRVPGPR